MWRACRRHAKYVAWRSKILVLPTRPPHALPHEYCSLRNWDGVLIQTIHVGLCTTCLPTRWSQHQNRLQLHRQHDTCLGRSLWMLIEWLVRRWMPYFAKILDLYPLHPPALFASKLRRRAYTNDSRCIIHNMGTVPDGFNIRIIFNCIARHVWDEAWECWLNGSFEDRCHVLQKLATIWKRDIDLKHEPKAMVGNKLRTKTSTRRTIVNIINLCGGK